MRQNRDIARTNSAQSIRIRNLENEISRLLAENLGYREEVAHLRKEAQAKTSQRVAEHALAIKAQLEAKLLEIGALVVSLDSPALLVQSPKTQQEDGPSPIQRHRRARRSANDFPEHMEGWLPPILEDKQYPRRTMRYELQSENNTRFGVLTVIAVKRL